MSQMAALSITTPWSEAWLQALASFSHPGRLRRGQQFADRRRVRRLEVKVGEIKADVKETTAGIM